MTACDDWKAEYATGQSLAYNVRFHFILVYECLGIDHISGPGREQGELCFFWLLDESKCKVVCVPASCSSSTDRTAFER